MGDLQTIGYVPLTSAVFGPSRRAPEIGSKGSSASRMLTPSTFRLVLKQLKMEARCCVAAPMSGETCFALGRPGGGAGIIIGPYPFDVQ